MSLEETTSVHSQTSVQYSSDIFEVDDRLPLKEAMMEEVIMALINQIRNHSIPPVELKSQLQKLFRNIVRLGLQHSHKIKNLLSALRHAAFTHGFAIENPLMGLELAVVNSPRKPIARNWKKQY